VLCRLVPVKRLPGLQGLQGPAAQKRYLCEAILFTTMAGMSRKTAKQPEFLLSDVHA